MTSPSESTSASKGDSARTAYEIALRRRLGPLSLEIEFSLHAPWTVLFAPSGAGKSTVLRMIAGLDRPDAGHVLSRGQREGGPPQERLLADTPSGVYVPAHRRPIRMVAQRTALFPHLSVIRNVQYGVSRRTQGDEGRREHDRFLEEVLQLCRVTHLREKRPAQLSGGEAQRVALARSLAASGFNLLLLDEPFTGLETELRQAIVDDLRVYLGRLGALVLQVTHDVGEVFAAEAEVLRMEAGRIVTQGSAASVLLRERQALLAQLQR